MSNSVYKTYRIEDEEERVIDSNSRLEAKLAAFEKEYRRKQSAGEFPEDSQEGVDGELAGLFADREEEAGVPDVDYVAQAQEEAQQILEQAREEADRIINDAQGEIFNAKKEASEAGRQKGYIDGKAQAQQELDLEMERLDGLKAQLEEEHQREMESMERDVTDAVCKVVEHVFRVKFGNDREVIRFLIENTLSNVESSRQFLIKVSQNNLDYLNEHKEELTAGLPKDAEVDLILDPVLTEEECIIETDGGVFDCSISTQIESLTKQIRMLSME